ncbi:AAA family ATPase [Bradyrhizobium lablabi]|uniref:ATP-binding protein n=1 Tax=Bradyrhizobium lablabi TaxID=722472 RepID=UPI001BACEDB5|nr:adenylate/guanylate cyclase domain-containing protein [Bradyrhizobium lablabi]MBR1122722.1 AAA family ATPase [Bradyrhizobium lablabi]
MPVERNIITILAVDMVGSTRHIAGCDPEDAQSFLDLWYEHIRIAVERAGGLIVHYAGDGGIAMFGWPSSFEDHAERACRAAWDITQTTGAIGPQGGDVCFRVGVHSGLVGLRQAHLQGRFRFDIAGSTVHIAAKLQQKANPGEAVVSADVVKLCRSSRPVVADCDSLISSDGISVPAFILNERPKDAVDNDIARRYRQPIVNRSDELAVIRENLPRPGGPSRSIGLVGEPGIGKSRLAAAAVTDAIALDTKVLVFQGDAQKRTTPFAAVRALVDDLLGQNVAASSDRLRLVLGGRGLNEEDVLILESLFFAPGPRGTSQPRNRTETEIARALVNACLALAPSTRPTLLLIEDLQLIDSESRLFLQLLARAPKPEQPICLLLTGRPEAINEARETADTLIVLEPLTRSHMEHLGRQLWSGGAPPAAVLAHAIDRAEGVPFLLEEFLRSMETSETAAGQNLPQSVESVIHARLQRLSPGAKTLAQALSLLGESVEVDLARAVLDADLPMLLNDLAELERYAFVHPLAGNSTSFRHQIIAVACSDTLTRERRQKLHRAAIREIILRHPNLSGRYQQLAFHAVGAGEDPIALDYLWKAALEAFRGSAAVSLNLIFDQALQVMSRMGEAAEKKYVDFVLMAFAPMLQLGEFRKMNEHLPRTMDLARRHGLPHQVCSLHSQLGMICWFEGRYEEGLRLTREGLQMAKALKSPGLIFANQFMMANALHGMGQIKQAIEALKELDAFLTGDLENARLGSVALPKSLVPAFMSWFMNATGEYAEALDHASRALEIAVRAQDPYSEVLARNTMGRNLLLLRRNSEAVQCFAIARELSDRNGYDAIKANLTGAAAAALARTGEARAAVRLVEQCLHDGFHRRTGQMEVGWLYAGYAEALVRCGEHERAVEALERALEIAHGLKNPWLLADCLGLSAHLLTEIEPGHPRIAADLAEQRETCQRFGVAVWTMDPAQPTALAQHA